MTDYKDVKAINWSTLKFLETSPLEYRYRIDHPEPAKKDYIIGSAGHCAILEPEEFDKRYALCEMKRDKRHKAYQEWLDEHQGCVALNLGEYDLVRGMTDAVLSHRIAQEVLTGCRHEEPLVWDDPDTGLACKGRVDGINFEYVLDLKTTRDVSPRRFARSAAEYMYHGQLSLYHTGATVLRKIDGKTPPNIIAVDKEPPHDVAVYRMKHEDLGAGRRLVLKLMQRLQECMAADYWPGCAPDIQYLELPPWAPGLRDENNEEDF